MARNVATTVENNFVLGLITERTELRFPQNAATDMDNCIVDLYGRVSRRPGLDLEENYVANGITNVDGDVFTEYFWESVNGDSATAFLVQQHGKTISFFDLSTSDAVGSHIVASTLDLTTYIPTSSGEDPALNPCSYTAGFGKLIIANTAIDPIIVTYNSSNGLITAQEVALKTRDFEGVVDNLALTDRPTESVATLKNNNPNHYYNLLNQGWFTGDALSQWDTDLTTVPSNADIVGLYRASATDAFDAAIVTSKSPGNTYAPKGHFILDAFNPDRTAALIAEGFTGAVVGGTITLVDRTLGTNIGDMTGNGGLAASFNGISTELKAASSTRGAGTVYVGKNYSGPGGSTISGAQITLSSDGVVNTSTTFTLYAKNTAPANATDGTVLGSLTTTPTVNNRIIGLTSNSAATWQYFWVTMSSGSTSTKAISEVVFYASGSASVTSIYKRPSVVTFFNGRVFYAGTDAGNFGSKIYFTRIIETDAHYSQCFSDNDPASETLSDFLPSDGGVISIPDCGLVTQMFSTQSSIIVLATNGVWLLSGSGGGPFTASSYQLKQLSGVGAKSPHSVVDYKGQPVWWGADGIYTVSYNSNYDSYDIVSITQDSIKSFYQAIPATNRQFAKGIYNIEEDILMWVYSDSDTLTTDQYYRYNKALIFVPRSKAFYPWTFNSTTPSIRGITHLSDARRTMTPSIKYTVTHGSFINYAKLDSSEYKDWTIYANEVSLNLADQTDYTSYFLAGYYIHGETQRFFQGNYVFVFLDQDTQGSCFMKTIYDWTTSGNSGKWSPEQQVYPDWQSLQSVNYRRLKTRGKGRAMQLYFESEEGKPFSIIGWSVFESGNAGI